MSGAPFLEHLWLVESAVESAERELFENPLEMHLDIEELAFSTEDSDTAVVRASLSFALETEETVETEVYAADLTATFDLVYRMRPLETIEEQQVFACQRALPDLWPVWRSWLHTTLALMGLPPTSLPAQIPSQLIVEGEEAFDLTRQVQAVLDRL